MRTAIIFAAMIIGMCINDEVLAQHKWMNVIALIVALICDIIVFIARQNEPVMHLQGDHQPNFNDDEID